MPIGHKVALKDINEGDTLLKYGHDIGKAVASIGKGDVQIYPGSSDCGGSAFDSCDSLQPGDFWQFTFTEAGTWEFQNNANTKDVGEVIVQ